MIKSKATGDTNRHHAMRRVKSRDTSIEVSLRRALWHAGIRYRKNDAHLPGTPDIAITKYQIAIFCDGEFWHGKDWPDKKACLKRNRDYWINKIERNMCRDRQNDWALCCLGWTVLRFWGVEIHKDLPSCIDDIKCAIIQNIIENGPI